MITHILKWLGLKPHREISHSKHSLNALKPHIVPRPEHSISRQNIHPHALKVLYRLKDAGFEAYLVGGGIRDLLLGFHPKDFDVVTNAHPEQIKNIFRNCRLIGRRFRLAHIFFGDHIVEVATFRGNGGSATNVPHASTIPDKNAKWLQKSGGMIVRDNVYGKTIEEDVMRRDFTINGLYYNIKDFSIIDYVGGLKDLHEKTIRLIGDPYERFKEDPVRMLRALRFMGKLGFHLAPNLEKPLLELGHCLKEVSPARLLDEFTKLFMAGYSFVNFKLLQQYEFLDVLFPSLSAWFKHRANPHHIQFVELALKNTDIRVKQDLPVLYGFVFAALLWPLVFDEIHKRPPKMGMIHALMDASQRVLTEQQSAMMISKHVAFTVREIWVFQGRLERRAGHHAASLFHHPRFKAVYDFLLLRSQAGEPGAQELASWWQAYMQGDENMRWQMAMSLQKRGGARKHRRKSMTMKKTHRKPKEYPQE